MMLMRIYAQNLQAPGKAYALLRSLEPRPGMAKDACKCAKMAAADDFVLDASFHYKLASIILSTEEGRMYAQRCIEKAHGAEAASLRTQWPLKCSRRFVMIMSPGGYGH